MIASLAIAGRILIVIFLPRVTVTSWFRDPLKNLRVGGKLLSGHQLAISYDVVPATSENERTLKTIFPVVVNERTHLHAGWFG